MITHASSPGIFCFHPLLQSIWVGLLAAHNQAHRLLADPVGGATTAQTIRLLRILAFLFSSALAKHMGFATLLKTKNAALLAASFVL